jgi:hypothetical protein
MLSATSGVDRQTVKCEGRDAKYFIEGGRRRFYSDESWRVWGNPSPIIVPCAALDAVLAGTPMPGNT